MNSLRIENGYCKNREGVHFEAKEAKNGIPRDAWETYSAFANTDGGTIVFGLKEEGNSLKVVGVPDAEGRLQNIWNMLNNQEFISSNLLSNNDLRIADYEGCKLIIMDVPRAERSERPVYTHGNPRNAYRRNGEGDYKCSPDEIRSMIVDSSAKSTDLSIVENLTVSDLSKKTVTAYRNNYKVTKIESEWHDLNDEEFLRILGAAKYDDGVLRPTIAGLMMFGESYHICSEIPNYMLDYREYSEDSTNWTSRFTSDDGNWSGNLYDFYTECIRRLKKSINHGMAIGPDLKRIDDIGIDKVLREALLNAIANTDRNGSGGLVVERRPDVVIIRNPGTFRIPLDKAEAGGLSDPRNPTVLKMFTLLGFGERAGTGIPRMNTLCMMNGLQKPIYSEDHQPDRVTVRIKVTDEEGPMVLEEMLLDIISDNPKASITSMSDKTGKNRNTVARTLDKMKDQGLIERIDGTRGYWMIIKAKP